MTDSPFMSRKFLLALVLLLSTIVLAWLGKMDVTQFMDFSKWILGIYSAANAVEAFSTKQD